MGSKNQTYSSTVQHGL